MLSKAHLTSHPGCLALGEWSHHHGYLGYYTLLYSSSVSSCHLFLILPTSDRSILLLSLIVPIFAWNVLLVSLIFLKRFLVFPTLMFSSINLYWSLGRLYYLSLLFLGTVHSYRHIFPFLHCLSLLFSPIYKVSSGKHFAFLHFFFPWGWFWSLPPVQCCKPLSTVLQAFYRL